MNVTNAVKEAKSLISVVADILGIKKPVESIQTGNEVAFIGDRASSIYCLYPDCPFTRRTRGQCHGHYSVWRSYARLGKAASDADLIARGLLLPEGTGGVKSNVGYDAFLKGSTVRGRA